MWGLARLARRPLGGGKGSGALAVLNRQQLSRGSSVTVIRVADRALVLGVTDQQVSVLGETDLETFEEYVHPEHRESAVRAAGALDGSVLSRNTWRSAINYLRDRTV